MGGLFGDVHEKLKECCCGPGCTGCCFPTDEMGNPANIPFEIDAPGCALDGYTDELIPEAIANSTYPCGLCGSYALSTAFSVPGLQWMPNPPDGCDLSVECSITFCVRLVCDGLTHGETSPPAGGECCRGLRLLVSVPYEFEGAVYAPGDLSCLGGVDIWQGYVAPDSCTCEGGLSAIFSLAKFVPLAKNDPECGNVQPCVPQCDMSLLKLVI